MAASCIAGVLMAQRLGRRILDREVVGSIHRRGVIRTPRSTQSSIPPGQIDRVPAFLAGVKAGRARLWQAAAASEIV